MDILAQEQDPQELIDQIPPEVLDRLPQDIVDRIRDGTLDQIPDTVVDRLPPGLVDSIPDGLLESAAANPALSAILIAVGVIAVLLFFWGIVKSAFKAALFAAVVGGGAWAWYFYIQ